MVFERKYSDEVRQRSVARVLQRRSAEPHNRSIVREVAAEFDVGPQSLRQWLARYDDGSYDYEPSPRRAQRSPQHSSSDRGNADEPAVLLSRIEELQRQVKILQDDNRSLTRVVALLSEELRTILIRGTGADLRDADDIEREDRGDVDRDVSHGRAEPIVPVG